MTESPQEISEVTPQATLTDAEVEGLVQGLRRKQGTWVEWGQACQQLQKAGYTPQTLFEATGFEPIQQNQIIVGAQVYSSILHAGVSAAVQEHFERRGSDSLYELRVLTQPERAAAAEFLVEKRLDAEAAREVAKAIKERSRLAAVPEEFTEHPGDAIAYQCWKTARQKSDLQERSRLIAKGLQYAHSATARKQIEQLLVDFSVAPSVTAPRLPVYRLDTDDQMPRILPVAGKLPLHLEDLKAVPMLEETGPFKLVQFSGTGAWVPIPGWQVILNAEDPIALLCDSDAFPTPLPGRTEEVVVVVDRSQRQWDANNYFMVEHENQIQLQWFETAPERSLLGQVILVMRPKKILDENVTRDPWQIDE